MIKLLKNKLFISMFLLVICVCITSSCFATELSEQYSQYYVLGGSISDLGVTSCVYDGPWPVTNLKYGYFKIDNNIYCLMVDGSGDKLVNFKQYTNMRLEGVSGTSCYYKKYNFETNSWEKILSSSGISCSSLPITVFSETEYNIYLSDGTLIYNYQEVYQEFVNTNFNYKFEAETKNRLALTITDLDSSYKMIGFVNNPITYSVGDTLRAGIDINYQRITPGDLDDDYRYFGYLSPGETLTYYIVDEDYAVVDAGVIDDLSNGYFLYAYTNEQGIKYSFLKDGSFYWDDTLDFVWTDPNGYQYHNDQIITLSERYITVYEDVYSYTVTGTVYDADGNILGQADCTYIQEQGYLNFDFNRVFYDDYVVLGDLGKLLNNKIHSNYIINDIILSGLNPDGTYIDYSNYSVFWKIDTSIISTINNFEVNNVKSSSYYGTFTGFVSSGLTGTLSFELDLSLIYSNYTPFNFVFEVYNDSGYLVYTKTLSSDEFIKKQIDSNKNTGLDKTYNVINSSNYNKNNGLNFNNIINWNEDDYKKLLSTDNFVWQFLLTVINLLPWWICMPIAILLFGVVFISLLRFIRGG